MAFIALRSTLQKTGVGMSDNEIGDCLEVRDKDTFSPTEKTQFAIIEIPDVTAEEIRPYLMEIEMHNPLLEDDLVKRPRRAKLDKDNLRGRVRGSEKARLDRTFDPTHRNVTLSRADWNDVRLSFRDKPKGRAPTQREVDDAKTRREALASRAQREQTPAPSPRRGA